MKRYKHVFLLAAVSAAHATLFYALLAGLLLPAPKPEAPPKELVISLVPLPPKREEPPQASPPKPEPPPPQKHPKPEQPVAREPAPIAAKPKAEPLPTPAPALTAAAMPAPSAAEAPPPTAPAIPTPPRNLATSAVQVLSMPKPEYPVYSRRMGEEGIAYVRILINERGLVESASIKTPSGFPRLDDAALVAAKRAVFKPYVEEGKALKGYVVVPYEFKLNEG